MRNPRTTLASIVLALATGGCGGGAALMHPAHALPEDRTTLGAGVGSQFVLGGGADAIDEARATMNDSLVEPDEEQRYVRGALARALLAPGLSPWVGARAGLGYTSDAGITYSGRALRVDARHAFEAGDLALSAGLGGSYVLRRGGSDRPSGDGSETAVPGLDTGRVWGFGADVPLLVGWRSDADLFQVWLGARGGWERLRGDVLLGIDPTLQADEVELSALEAERFYALGVVGFAVTVHPVAIAIELDGGYQRGDGSLRRSDPAGGPRRIDGQVEGFTLTPTAALIGHLWD